MAVEFRLPDLGEGIHEGEIVEVLVAVGDKVVDGQPVLIVETDKATTEIPAPVSGRVKDIRVRPGETVKVGDVLMTFEEEAGARHRKGVEVSPEPPVAEAPVSVEGRIEAAPGGTPPTAAGETVAATPSTRRLARELGVDLRLVSPSGPGGRVTPEDVRAFAAEKARVPVEPREKPVPEEREEVRSPEVPRASIGDADAFGPIERVPLRSVRKATAKHMALAWSQIPHVTHQDAADITELDRFRRRHKADVEKAGGALSLTVFVLKAVVAALKDHPRFNATLDNEAGEIILKHYYHVGVAVDTDRGLIVPVIRDADSKSLVEIAGELPVLVKRTREGKIDRDDMAGGTFTITNIGILGGTGFTPIVNYPQVAILGLGRAGLQPVVAGDEEEHEIVPRLVLPLILGFDHRVLDGADAARFLNAVIHMLQDPEKLLMKI